MPSPPPDDTSPWKRRLENRSASAQASPTSYSSQDSGRPPRKAAVSWIKSDGDPLRPLQLAIGNGSSLLPEEVMMIHSVVRRSAAKRSELDDSELGGGGALYLAFGVTTTLG